MPIGVPATRRRMQAALRRSAPTGCRASQNVEDSTVAAAFERGTHNKPNATAPTTNSAPIARRRPLPMLVTAIARQLLLTARPDPDVTSVTPIDAFNAAANGYVFTW